MPLRLAAVLLAVAACSAPAEKPKKSPPAEILIIRHAEKPPEGDASYHLSAAGKKRAEALHLLFKKTEARPAPFVKPDVLFAAADSKKSHRSTETLAPLAKRLGLSVNAAYHSSPGGPGKGRGIADLAAELLGGGYRGKVVLIAWHHGRMPELAGALGVRGPLKYHSTEFGRVWRITFDADGRARLEDLSQRLMPGDAK